MWVKFQKAFLRMIVTLLINLCTKQEIKNEE
jgi:hypothetical protein